MESPAQNRNSKPLTIAQHRSRGAWIFGSLLLALVIGVFVFAPNELPVYKQRMLAFGCAALAGFWAYFFVGALGLGVKSVQTRLGEIILQSTSGFGLFALVLLWWFSPFAPIATNKEPMPESRPTPNPSATPSPTPSSRPSPTMHSQPHAPTAKLPVTREGIYSVRITILDPQGIPLEDAHVVATVAGERQDVGRSREFEIPAEKLPRNGQVTFYAFKESAFLMGRQSLILGSDYHPTVTIQVTKDNSANISGTVVGESGEALQGARISVDSSGKSVRTNEEGYFELPANAAKSQMVRLHIEKEGYEPKDKSLLAGSAPVKIGLRRQ